MLNINELENRWLHYKIKSYLLPTIVICIIIILSIVLFMLTRDKEETKENIQVPVLKEKIKSTQIKPIDNNKEKFISNNKMTLSPSLDFVRTMQVNSPKYYTQQKQKTISKKENNNKSIVKKKKEVIVVKKQKVEIVKENLIKIKRQNTQEDIQHVISRFKKSNNPALSLFVAKKYYEMGNYNQAYNYALITNEINKDIEDSWIIFGKSLYMLGKKDKAIHILKKYIKQSHSQKAKITLDNIKSGKLK